MHFTVAAVITIHLSYRTPTQLCSTRFGRVFLQSKQTYLVMREYHKWETDKEVSLACQKLIHTLISDEPQEGMENLHEVELPEGFTLSQPISVGNFIGST